MTCYFFKNFRKNGTTLKRDQSLTLDKPLTFNSRIKSSGYNSTTKRERFQPMINKSSTSLSLSRLDTEKKMKKLPELNKSSSFSNEFRFRMPDALKNKFIATDKSSPIVDLKFSNDGHHFAFVSSDNLIQYAMAANPEKPGLSLSSHQDLVLTYDTFSNHSEFLVS